MTRKKPTTALEALSFCLGDVQSGIGPFVSVFLLGIGWGPGRIGAVMTIGGIAGMLATPLAGAWVDSSNAKRQIVALSAAVVGLASTVLWLTQLFPVVALSQIAASVSGAVFGPAITGLTLGMTGHAGFDQQFARNQVWNHAGNLVVASLCGILAWRLGFHSILVINVVFSICAIVSVLAIPRNSINDRQARGQKEASEQDHGDVSGISTLLRSRPLLILAVTLALFNLGNAAVQSLYGLAVVGARQADPNIFTAETIVIAQLVMLVAAVFANRLIKRFGYWTLIFATFCMLPLRGLMAALILQPWGVWPVQTLDGIGAGLQSVVVPALVVRLLKGSGRINAGQGAVIAVQAIGASLSPALGGAMAERFGYATAFYLLAGIAPVALVLWFVYRADIIKQSS